MEESVFFNELLKIDQINIIDTLFTLGKWNIIWIPK